MRALVIGAKGFVGASLVRALLHAGHAVTALELRGSAGRLADVADDIEWVVGDGSSTEAILAGLHGPPVEALYYGPYYRSPPGTPGLDRELDVMVLGAARAFHCARAFDHLRVVFPSSIAVHGSQPDDGEPLSESSRLSPFGLYGAGKILCEQLALQMNADLGRNAVSCVRLPSVYGPGAEAASRGVNIPAVAAARGQVGRLSFTPASRVCMGHVDDVADALARIMEAREPQHTIYEAGGLDASFADIAGAVAEIVPGARTEFGRDQQRALPNLIEWARVRLEFGASHRALLDGMATVIDHERPS